MRTPKPEPCGCIQNATHWLYLCPPHRAESDALDAAFMAATWHAGRFPVVECRAPVNPPPS